MITQYPFTYDDKIIAKKTSIHRNVKAVCSAILGTQEYVDINTVRALRDKIIELMETGMSPKDIKIKYSLPQANFSSFVQDALGITLRNRSNSAKIALVVRGHVSDGRDLYHNQCQFSVDPYSMTSSVGYNRLLELGMYHPIKNPYGVTRDHMLSIEYGWRNNIDPSIISHAANCEFLTLVENSRKGSSSSISLEYLNNKIKFNSTTNVPVKLVLPKTEQHRRNISDYMKSIIRITDGNVNRVINKHDEIPEGFRRGITRGLKQV